MTDLEHMTAAAAAIPSRDDAVRAMLAALQDVAVSRFSGFDLPWGTVDQAIALAKAAGIREAAGIKTEE